MKQESSPVIDAAFAANPFDFQFTTKPLIYGGLAMEYYGLRKHGHDIDFIVSFEDFETLVNKYPEGRKDSWGDLGVYVQDYEMFRTVWKLDYAFLSEGSHEYRDYRVVGLDRLLLLKVLAKDVNEKQKKDFDLVVRYILDKNQRPDIVEFMNSHVPSYLASKDGFVFKGEYLE